MVVTKTCPQRKILHSFGSILKVPAWNRTWLRRKKFGPLRLVYWQVSLYINFLHYGVTSSFSVAIFSSKSWSQTAWTFFLCLWFRASLIYINNCPTSCNTKQSIYYSASSLYMFRVSTPPIIRSTQNCNYSLRYWSCCTVQLPPSNVADQYRRL